MTTAIQPVHDEELEARADDAERTLLRTLDALSARRRHVRDALVRTRESLESGAKALSLLLLTGVAMLCVFSLTRRMFRRRPPSRR